MQDFDYSDSFRVTSVPDVTARTWARLSLDSGPGAGRRLFGQLVWHGLLGFELSDAPGTLAGWTVVRDDDDALVLACDGRRMRGRMEFAVEGPTTIWTTTLHHHDRCGRIVWGAAQHVHRALVPRILARVSASLCARGEG
jgi:hypothetical protein